MECVCVEVCKPNASPFFVATWYSPHKRPLSIFDSFEQFTGRLDCLDKELFILGDANCDQLPDEPDGPTNILNNICSIYQIVQLMKERTQITPYGESLTDPE